MAYHEVAMWEVLGVLERLKRLESKSAVARARSHLPADHGGVRAPPRLRDRSCAGEDANQQATRGT
jgi:hypothetical protein